MAINVNLRYTGRNGNARRFAGEMAAVAALREKYDLHMTVERYVSAETPETENRFVREQHAKRSGMFLCIVRREYICRSENIRPGTFRK